MIIESINLPFWIEYKARKTKSIQSSEQVFSNELSPDDCADFSTANFKPDKHDGFVVMLRDNFISEMRPGTQRLKILIFWNRN